MLSSKLSQTRRTQTGAAIVLALALFACKRGSSSTTDSTSQAAPPVAPAPQGPAVPANAGATVAFQGVYTKTAEMTQRNGVTITTGSSGSKATLNVEPGKVTYSQTYTSRGQLAHVTQYYTFSSGDVRTVEGGNDVSLTFVKMDADTKSYNPDKNAVKLQARKQAGGWQIGFISTDDKGVWGGVEFR